MTAADWLGCDNPGPMLTYLPGSARMQERKARLFACACCRRVMHLLAGAHERVVGMVEEYVESWGRGGLHAARRAHREAGSLVDAPQAGSDRVAYCRTRARSWASSSVWEAARQNPATAAEAYRAAAQGVGFWRKAEEEASGVVLDPLLHAEPAEEELRAQAATLRDIVGDPFRPITLDTAHRSSTVVSLARAAYDERRLPAGDLDPHRLAVLADALEEAGATDELVSHLRSPGPHVWGCWAIDLCLGLS